MVDPPPQARAPEPGRRAEAAEARVASLERALVTRPAIEQAKGLLMGVFGIGPDAAFQALVCVSQNTNVKLALVAQRFLRDVRDVEFDPTTREQVTQLLAGTACAP